MRVKIISDGHHRNTKVVDVETGAKLEGITYIEWSVGIHNLSLARITMVGIPTEIVSEAEVTEKKLVGKPVRKKISKETSTIYSNKKLANYDKSILESEGRQDLEVVRDKGIDADNTLETFLWKSFLVWSTNEPRTKKTISQIADMVTKQMSIHPNPTIGPMNNTTLHHTLNKFTFLGLLLRKKSSRGVYKWGFERKVLYRGLGWFKRDNLYMKGNFQEGLFGDLLKGGQND